MPIHDWTRVDGSIFYAFHHWWISALAGALNQGLLPRTHYALAEVLVKRKAVVVRQTIDHGMVAVVEIVTPTSKNSVSNLEALVRTSREMLADGVHLLIVDLFPRPTERSDRPEATPFETVAWKVTPFLSTGVRENGEMACVSYMAGPKVQAYVNQICVGNELPDMPLFLAADRYIQISLEATYQKAWDSMPAYWREVLSA